jgi:hypothetical protein
VCEGEIQMRKGEILVMNYNSDLSSEYCDEAREPLLHITLTNIHTLYAKSVQCSNMKIVM